MSERCMLYFDILLWGVTVWEVVRGEKGIDLLLFVSFIRDMGGGLVCDEHAFLVLWGVKLAFVL